MATKISESMKLKIRKLCNILRRTQWNRDAWLYTLDNNINPKQLASFKYLTLTEMRYLTTRAINNAHINFQYEYIWLTKMAKSRKLTTSQYLKSLLERM